MKQESKIKSRITKLSKKNKDDLIQIILTKDKESNKLNGRINELFANNQRLLDINNQCKDIIEDNRFKAQLTEERYIDELNVLLREKNKYMWTAVCSVIVNIMLVILGLSIL